MHTAVTAHLQREPLLLFAAARQSGWCRCCWICHCCCFNLLLLLFLLSTDAASPPASAVGGGGGWGSSRGESQHTLDDRTCHQASVTADRHQAVTVPAHPLPVFITNHTTEKSPETDFILLWPILLLGQRLRCWSNVQSVLGLFKVSGPYPMGGGGGGCL